MKWLWTNFCSTVLIMDEICIFARCVLARCSYIFSIYVANVAIMTSLYSNCPTRITFATMTCYGNYITYQKINLLFSFGFKMFSWTFEFLDGSPLVSFSCRGKWLMKYCQTQIIYLSQYATIYSLQTCNLFLVPSTILIPVVTLSVPFPHCKIVLGWKPTISFRMLLRCQAVLSRHVQHRFLREKTLRLA